MKREQTYQAKIPLSTYRLQLNHAFTFAAARGVVGYLADLGITDLYASSYLKARPGSLHGYDIVDFGKLNDEIGSEEEYGAFIAEQQRYGMGQLFDLVPNHMCIASMQNAWWMDVLENGPSSVYARFFDINWRPVKAELRNKILVPFLGDQYGRILENKELQLVFQEGAFYVCYWNNRFPVRPDTYMQILAYRLKELEVLLSPQNQHFVELLSINTALSHLPGYTETDPDKIAERDREKEIVKKRLLTLYNASDKVREFIDENIRRFNGIKGDKESFDLLDRLLRDQAYRLSYWRVATEEINYRRFFDINDLAAIRMEDPIVFAETHKRLLRLIREGKVTGLRVDHPDGLYDPFQYFHRLQRECYVQNSLRLREATDERMASETGQAIITEELVRKYDELTFSDPGAKPFYIVGEKILMRNETMPAEWPIFSTVGYTFLNLVNGIFIDTTNEKAFDRIYRRFIRSTMDYEKVVYEKKKLIMQRAMSSEINTLGNYLNRISEKNRDTRDFTLISLTAAIIEVIAFFPVYRTYIDNWNISERDRRHIEYAVGKAKRMNAGINESVFDFLRDVLLLDCPPQLNDDGRAEWLDFAMRFQQITGPVMAKGLEDTAFYIYSRLISLNEVGGSPNYFGVTLEEFHEHNLKRQKFWPHALITTSTHDSKRSEDVRARINVLSEMPADWLAHVLKWKELNRRKRAAVNGAFVPDANEEYFLYQTLVGTWPIQGTEDAAFPEFVERIKHYVLKALREAKVNTSWINPKIEYENGFLKFIDAVLSTKGGNEFLNDLGSFERKVAYCGMFNALSQTLIKIMSPGVPDFYQGTETWNFSLVDPDNRRPVDYEQRKKMLRDLRQWEKEAPLQAIASELLKNWTDGRIKLYVTYKALNFRKEYGEQLKQSRYTPLDVAGERSGHICAFARRSGNTVMIAAAPRFMSRLLADGATPAVNAAAWQKSLLSIPGLPVHSFRDIFTGAAITAVDYQGAKALACRDLFSAFPVALLVGGD